MLLGSAPCSSSIHTGVHVWLGTGSGELSSLPGDCKDNSCDFFCFGNWGEAQLEKPFMARNHTFPIISLLGCDILLLKINLWVWLLTCSVYSAGVCSLLSLAGWPEVMVKGKKSWMPGKRQGISIWVRENWSFEEKLGKLKEFNKSDLHLNTIEGWKTHLLKKENLLKSFQSQWVERTATRGGSEADSWHFVFIWSGKLYFFARESRRVF